MTLTDSIPTSSSSLCTWPNNRFYWAVLDSPGFARTGALPPGLLPALADEIPESLDTLHAVCTPIPSTGNTPQRVLICACRIDALAALDPSIIEFKPDAIPAQLGLPHDLTPPNLLTGDHEPAPLRSARLARHTILAAALLTGSLLISIGLFRRAQHLSTSAASATRGADTLLADLASDHRESTLAASATNTAALATVARSTRLPRDAALDLASLLTAWPVSTPAKPQSLSIADNTISLAVTIESDPASPATSTDPAIFLKSFSAPAGMSLDEPRVATLAGISRVNLTLHPASPALAGEEIRAKRESEGAHSPSTSPTPSTVTH